jgi:nitrate reductase NapE component
MASVETYPVRVEAELEPGLSRWLWLVKWFLAIPHYIVLSFLWVAFGVLTVVAFFAILFTGRYPRSIFEFNVGVLRWSWRVADYSFGVLATDRYPPFTLSDVPEYPARLDVAYPEHLSRGLVLVKWILAIPHLLIVGILAGGGSWVAWNVGQTNVSVWGNLIGLLVLIAAVVLAFTGRYPRGLFDLVLGLNRWVLRVGAYVGLMTDQYPPFRLDMGGSEPGGTLTIPRPPERGPLPPPASRPDVSPGRAGWTGGRITALVLGVLFAILSVGLFGGGGFLLWADRTQRDAHGYISTGLQHLETGTYALTTGTVVGREIASRWLYLEGPGVFYGPSSSETLRLRVTPVDPSERIFVGIAPSASVAAYLSGVSRTTITDFGEPAYRTSTGGAPAATPATQAFWVRSSTGDGTRTVLWPIQRGSWTVVVMNADGARGIDVRADAGAKFPPLPWIAVGLLIAGAVVLAVGVVLIVGAVRRAGRASMR